MSNSTWCTNGFGFEPGYLSPTVNSFGTVRSDENYEGTEKSAAHHFGSVETRGVVD